MMENTDSMNVAVQVAVTKAREMRHEYLMPEHVLYGLLQQDKFMKSLSKCGVDGDIVKGEIEEWLSNQDSSLVPFSFPLPSAQFSDLMKGAVNIAIKNAKKFVSPIEYVQSLLMLKDSEAAYLLGTAIEGFEEMFLAILDDVYDEFVDAEENDEESATTSTKIGWKSLVTDISEMAKTHAPLIGREKELDRTIQILCRKEKNNPLHVGDPGVGKTALIFGLAKLIERKNVPERLKKRKIYGVNIGNLLAGTQYRGDFEKKLKSVLDGAAKEHAILYLDEIHNMVGAGRGVDGGPDASNILKPYLEMGNLSFIGATTHEEYNKRIAKDRAIVRRFQTIDIQEPSVDETIDIVRGLQTGFQKFHNVIYRKDALEYAVRASAKLIPERRLPDKAIDLIDEAGAYLEVHPNCDGTRTYVTKKNIDEILMRVCKIQAESLKEDGNENLAALRNRILSQIYGQDKAIDDVVDAIMMAKAGLNDDDKPLASLLFVGPTGVGKTEVARVLARELGVELVRFDMSEYTEKHTVAKLIGSPAGYVGYEDGGLLTDAIKKTPNCVLLLDEIEKAHSDIYNILLQVMDYAKLTDNRGRKADFRNVVLIMTSNAGAQYASQANIGFGGNVSRGDAMMKQVKKTFKPEFINRLSDIVVFNDMDKKMAGMIFNKKIGELEAKLQKKNIRMALNVDAYNYLLEKSFTKEYGAREMDRVIARELKPLLMSEILFGKHKKKAVMTVDCIDGKLCIVDN